MTRHSKWLNILGQFYCWLGFHTFRVVDVKFGFGASGNVEKIQCQRCGLVTIRPVRS